MIFKLQNIKQFQKKKAHDSFSSQKELKKLDGSYLKSCSQPIHDMCCIHGYTHIQRLLFSEGRDLQNKNKLKIGKQVLKESQHSADAKIRTDAET